jgi:hypothetical protein
MSPSFHQAHIEVRTTRCSEASEMPFSLSDYSRSKAGKPTSAAYLVVKDFTDDNGHALSAKRLEVQPSSLTQ